MKSQPFQSSKYQEINKKSIAIFLLQTLALFYVNLNPHVSYSIIVHSLLKEIPGSTTEVFQYDPGKTTAQC